MNTKVPVQKMIDVLRTGDYYARTQLASAIQTHGIEVAYTPMTDAMVYDAIDMAPTSMHGKFALEIFREAEQAVLNCLGVAPTLSLTDKTNLEIRFGIGALVIDTGEFNERHAIILQPCLHNGEVGDNAKEEPRKDTGNVVLTFPTKEQADAVADALCLKSPTLNQAKAICQASGFAVVPFDESMQDLATIRANFRLMEAEVVRLRAALEAAKEVK